MGTPTDVVHLISWHGIDICLPRDSEMILDTIGQIAGSGAKGEAFVTCDKFNVTVWMDTRKKSKALIIAFVAFPEWHQSNFFSDRPSSSELQNWTKIIQIFSIEETLTRQLDRLFATPDHSECSSSGSSLEKKK